MQQFAFANTEAIREYQANEMACTQSALPLKKSNFSSNFPPEQATPTSISSFKVNFDAGFSKRG